MYEDQDLLSLRDYIDIIGRRRRLVLGVVALTAAAAAIASMFATFSYTSNIELLVRIPTSSGAVETAVYGATDLQTQQRLATSIDVTERVAERLGVDAGDPAEIRSLLDRVTVTAIEGADVLRISAEDADPATAADLPVAFAEEYLAHRRELTNERVEEARRRLRSSVEEVRAQIAEVDTELDLDAVQAPSEDDNTQFEEFMARRQSDARARALFNERDALLARLASLEEELAELDVLQGLGITGRVITPVTVPEQRPIVPTFLRNILLGVVLGATLGTALALVREWLDDRLVRERDMLRITGRGVMGRVPHPVFGEAVVPYDPHGIAAESYLALRASVTAWPAADATGSRISHPLIAEPGELPATVLVTGIDERSPASAVAANLAVAFARGGCRTLLIDGNRRPGASRHLADDGSEHLSLRDALLERADITQVPSPTDEPGLRVITPGALLTDAYERLTADRVEAFLRAFSGDVDVVVIDAGPASVAAGAIEFAKSSTRVLLVAEWAVSTRESLRQTMACLGQVGAQVSGTVLVQPMRSEARGAGTTRVRRTAGQGTRAEVGPARDDTDMAAGPAPR